MVLSNDEINLAKKLGYEILAILGNKFKDTKYLANNTFYPPIGFFYDPYIIGFCSEYVVTTTHYGVAENDWTQEKIGEFMITAFNTIDPENKLTKMLNEIAKNIDDVFKNKNAFEEGKNAASIYLLTLHDNPDPEDNDELLNDARRIAPRLNELKDMYEISDNDINNYRLPITVLIISIYQHILEKWVVSN